jgi:hypothetical protein
MTTRHDLDPRGYWHLRGDARAKAKRQFIELTEGRWIPAHTPDEYGVQRATLGNRKAYISALGVFEFGADKLTKAEAHALAAGQPPRRPKRQERDNAQLPK